MRSPFRLSRRLPFGVIAPVIESFTGLKTLGKLYHKHYKSTTDPADFASQALDILSVTYEIRQGSDTNIPRQGPLIVIANHPFGGIEGVVLMDMVLKQRTDVKVLANQELNALDGALDIFIGVNILEGTSAKRKNWLALNESKQWITSGGVLLLFPSGEVASWQWKHKKVVEAPWQKTVARLIQHTKASVLPVFFEGKNSPVFHSLGLIHPKARTLWLVRELINKKNSKISLRIGDLITAREMAPLEDKAAITNYLRLNTLLLGYQQQNTDTNKEPPLTPSNNSQQPVPVGCTLKHKTMTDEINNLNQDQLLIEKNGMQVWCAPAAHIPTILHEIGRLREITFRAVGEGSGQSIDIDEFDEYYQHLFLWNTEKQEIVGAYRIGHVDEIINQRGLEALYSQHLFGYDNNFLKKLSPCLEIGRSFIRQEYQKILNSLLLLWRGIGAYVAVNPQYRILFGPVSISSDYSEVSRQLIASCLTTNNYDETLAAMVNPVKPYKLSHSMPWTTEHLSGINQVELLSSLIKIIEGDKGIPILIKQYLKLQGEFAGFNIDENFSNALDGLIIVDLTRIDKRTLHKYMGPEKAESYLSYQKQAMAMSCINPGEETLSA